MEYISKSEKETFSIASKIASKAKPGDIFALSGDLGSGKTTFVKAFAKSLGIKESITSPTFVLLKQYPIPAKSKKGRFLIHVDCYRMEGPSDADSIGILDSIKKKESIILIEWAEKIFPILPMGFKKIKFSYLDEFSRRIEVLN